MRIGIRDIPIPIQPRNPRQRSVERERNNLTQTQNLFVSSTLTLAASSLHRRVSRALAPPARAVLARPQESHGNSLLCSACENCGASSPAPSPRSTDAVRA